MVARGYDKIDFVVCNLYPFQSTVAKEGVTIPEAVEEIDIGKYIYIYTYCYYDDSVIVKGGCAAGLVRTLPL